MHDELAEILSNLGQMNGEMMTALTGLNEMVLSLTEDIEQATSCVDVHERTKLMSDGVLGDLERIVAESRLVEPASSEFKENLRHMEEHYTMESERHIHEALARKRSGQSVVVIENEAKNSSEESEYGDNVDLF
jgi:hypothetical protein